MLVFRGPGGGVVEAGGGGPAGGVLGLGFFGGRGGKGTLRLRARGCGVGGRRWGFFSEGSEVGRCRRRGGEGVSNLGFFVAGSGCSVTCMSVWVPTVTVAFVAAVGGALIGRQANHITQTSTTMMAPAKPQPTPVTVNTTTEWRGV